MYWTYKLSSSIFRHVKSPSLGEFLREVTLFMYGEKK